jgi:hypothetical protein
MNSHIFKPFSGLTCLTFKNELMYEVIGATFHEFLQYLIYALKLPIQAIKELQKSTVPIILYLKN